MNSERDCSDLDSNQNDIEWISGNFKCQELSKIWSCVCARVGNSHTFELYKKNGDGVFEKVTEENDNNLMVLARLPKGMMKLARLPAGSKDKRLPKPGNMMDLARLPPQKRTPEPGNMMDLARLPVKKDNIIKPIQPCHYGHFNSPDDVGIGPCEGI